MKPPKPPRKTAVPSPYPYGIKPPSLDLPTPDPSLIQNSVAAILNPQLDYITNKYGAQMGYAQQALSKLTSQYAGELQALAGLVSAPYKQGERIVGGASKGLNTQLAGLGQTLGSSESAALAASQLPQTAGGQDVSPQGQVQAGKGSGGAAGAIGQAMINALQAEQQAAETYASKIPSFASAEGQQQIKQAIATISGAMADQLAQTTAQAPQLYYTIYNQLLDRAQNDRSIALQLYEWQVGQAQQAAQAKASVVSANAPTLAGRQKYWQSVADRRTKYDPHGYVWEGTTTGIRPVRDPQTGRPIVDPAFAAAQQSGALAQARVGVAQQNADTAARKAAAQIRLAQEKAAQAGAKPNVQLSRALGTWVNANGDPIPSLAGLKPPPLVRGSAQKQGKTIYGSAPHKNQDGVWVSRAGKPLSRLAGVPRMCSPKFPTLGCAESALTAGR